MCVCVKGLRTAALLAVLCHSGSRSAGVSHSSVCGAGWTRLFAGTAKGLLWWNFVFGTCGGSEGGLLGFTVSRYSDGEAYPGGGGCPGVMVSTKEEWVEAISNKGPFGESGELQ